MTAKRSSSAQPHDQAKDFALRHYEDALARHGDSPQGVNWSGVESQRLRFEVLAGIADLTGKRVHDVGCGLGHFADYLREQGTDCEYVGSDISPRMIDHATKRMEGGEFHLGDLLSEDASWMSADYLITSGVFNVKGDIEVGAWRAFVDAMITRMFAVARSGIAFNMMTSHVDYREPHLFYCDPAEMFAFCVERLGRRVVVRHEYPLWEYTLYVYK